MARIYSCDSGRCPFIDNDNQSTGMYFCRDNCGLGVDEDDYPEEDFEDELEEDLEDYEPDDTYLEVGYDPYIGGYTDDC